MAAGDRLKFRFYYGHFYGKGNYKYSGDAVKENVKQESDGEHKTARDIKSWSLLQKNNFICEFIR